MPVTTPLADPTIAIDGSPLLQLPDGVGSLKVVVRPEQTSVMPVIADGNGFTVATVVMWQVEGKAYVIIAVPEETPTSMPLDDVTVATAVLPLVHVPPPASLTLVNAPTHTGVFPAML